MSCSLSRVTVILTLGLNDAHDNKTTDIEVIACSPMSRLRKVNLMAGTPDFTGFTLGFSVFLGIYFAVRAERGKGNAVRV